MTGETFTQDFVDTLKRDGSNTLPTWNNRGGRDDKPTTILLARFPDNFDVDQNIIACKTLGYRMPLLNCAIHEDGRQNLNLKPSLNPKRCHEMFSFNCEKYRDLI